MVVSDRRSARVSGIRSSQRPWGSWKPAVRSSCPAARAAWSDSERLQGGHPIAGESQARTDLPESRSARSRTVTRHPAWASDTAEARPAYPAAHYGRGQLASHVASPQVRLGHIPSYYDL